MKTTILVIGRNALIMETILRLISSQPEWQGVGAMTDEDAHRLFSASPADIVLFGGGVNENSEHVLSTAFKSIHPVVKIVRHYGGGSGLLFNEILEALQSTSSGEEKINT